MVRYIHNYLVLFSLLIVPIMAMEPPSSSKGGYWDKGKYLKSRQGNEQYQPIGGSIRALLPSSESINTNNKLKLTIFYTGSKGVICEIKSANRDIEKISFDVYRDKDLSKIWDALTARKLTNITEISIKNMMIAKRFKHTCFKGLAKALPNVRSVNFASVASEELNEIVAFLNIWKESLDSFFVSIGKNQQKPDIKYGVYPNKQLRLPPIDSSNIEELMKLFTCLNPKSIDWVVLPFAEIKDEQAIANKTFKLPQALGSDWKSLKRLSMQTKRAHFNPVLVDLIGGIFSADTLDLSGDRASSEILFQPLWKINSRNLRAFEAYFNQPNTDPNKLISAMINIFNAQPNLEILEVYESWLHTAVVTNSDWNYLVNAAKHGGSKIKLMVTNVFTTWDQVGDLAAALPNVEYLAMRSLEGYIDPGADASDVIEVFKKFKKLKHVFVNVGDCIEFFEVHMENNTMTPVKITNTERLVTLKNQLFAYLESKGIKYSTKKMFDAKYKKIIHKEILYS